MISFITLSREPQKVVALDSNIGNCLPGVGMYELIHMDGTTLDLFQGYNQGAERAKYPILAFVHDDVKFLCNRIPFEKAGELAMKPMTGFIGAAGARVLSAEGCWWRTDSKDLRGMAAHPADNPFGMHWNIWPHGPAAEFGEVAVLDGVFLMCHKRTFKRVGGFDETTFKGFHFYDVDITLTATLKGLKNYAALIPLLHQSRGVPNENWEENRKLFVKKYAGKLPYALG